MKKRFILGLCILTLSLILSACGTSDVERLEEKVESLSQQVATLKEENKSLSEENKALNSDIISLKGQVKASDTSLISTIFWKDGNVYSVEDCSFYYDSFCSKAVDSTLSFYSPISIRIELSNGNNVYFTLSNEGIVWSVDKPYFSEVE